jgi:hypothetical protein
MRGAVSRCNHEQSSTPFAHQGLGIVVTVPQEFLAVRFGQVQAEMLRQSGSFLPSLLLSFLFLSRPY